MDRALKKQRSGEMELRLDISGNTLFIIPCCKTKKGGGQTLCCFVDPLASLKKPTQTSLL